MKVVFTGNASADHFYPLIAVAEELNKIIDEENLADTHLYYMSDKEFDKKALYENGIVFKRVSAGKKRNSLNSFLGGVFAVFQMFSIFPDVVFSTGGYAAYPALFAARILRIPVIVHESNSRPDEINLWAQKFAIAVTTAYKQEADFFDTQKLIHIGQPIRRELQNPTTAGAYEFLGLEKDTPVLWVLSGSRGAKKINRTVEEALPKLLNSFQVIHQTGKDDFDEMKLLTDASLMNHAFKYRYHIFDFLNQLSLKMIAGIADIVVSRAGSTLFEIAHWEIPAIIIPAPHSKNNHQIKNAYNYAREGACIVIEENNLTDTGLIFEINRIYNDEQVKAEMKQGARNFALKKAGEKIAKKIVEIVLSHEM